MAGGDDGPGSERATPPRDDTFVEQTSAGYRALRTALTHGAALVWEAAETGRIGASSGEENRGGVEVATFVLVPRGHARRLVLRDVHRRLGGRGHDVYRPTLTGQGDRRAALTPDVGVDTHVGGPR